MTTRKYLEGYIQGEVVKWARHTLGILASKCGTRAWRDDPDYVFWIPGGRPLLIEFKATGKKASEKQKLRHEEFRSAGYETQVHDSIEGAKLAVLRECAAAWFRTKYPHPDILEAEYRKLGWTWSWVDGIALGGGATHPVETRPLHAPGGEVDGVAPAQRRAPRPGDAKNVDHARGVLRAAKSPRKKHKGPAPCINFGDPEAAL